MSKEVYISGILRRALLRQGDEYQQLALTDELPRECSRYDLKLFFGAEAEFEVYRETLSLSEIRERLRQLSAAHDALYDLVSGMDPTLSTQLRLERMRSANENLAEEFAREFCENRLIGIPLHPSADLPGASNLVAQSGYDRAASIYLSLELAKSDAIELDKIWQRQVAEVFGNESGDVKRSLIDQGVFKNFIHILGQAHAEMNVEPELKAIKKYWESSPELKFGLRAEIFNRFYEAVESQVYSPVELEVHSSHVESEKHVREHRDLTWSDWARVGAIAVAAIVLGIVGVISFWPKPQPQQHQLAVLPFTSTNAADQVIAVGLAQSLNEDLSQFSSLWVPPWKPVSELKNIHASEPSSALGVDRLVTGVLERRDGQWTVRATLEDAKSQAVLAEKAIQVSNEKANGLEKPLLEQVASMLKLRVPADVTKRLSQKETSDPEAWESYERGRGYLADYKFDPAIDQLQKATEKDPHFAAAYAYLALACAYKFRATTDREWFEKTQQIYDRAASLDADFAPRHIARAIILEQKGKLPEAIQELERARILDPVSENVILELARIYDKADREQEAVTLLQETIKQHPASWSTRDQLGKIYFDHAQYALAERYFREAADLAPGNPTAFVNLGAIAISNGKYSDAIQPLEKAISLKPDGVVYANLGTAFFYLERYPEAVEAYGKAAGLLKHYHVIWRNLGDAYLEVNNKAKATDAYRTAIRELEAIRADRKDDPHLLEKLSLYYAKLGEKQKSQFFLAQALRSPVKDPQQWFDLTLIYELLGQHTKALGALRTTVNSGYSKADIEHAPELKQLRKDKRFWEIMGTTKPQSNVPPLR